MKHVMQSWQIELLGPSDRDRYVGKDGYVWFGWHAAEERKKDSGNLYNGDGQRYSVCGDLTMDLYDCTE